MTRISLCLSIIVMFMLAGCTVNKAKNDESLRQFFDKHKVTGSFTMLNNIDGKVTVYNLPWDTARVLPASTFKIVNGLIGLQTGVILNDTMSIPWDGITRPVAAWNKTMGFSEAFKVSNIGYFQEVARRIGRDTMRQWLDTLSYGNMKMGSRVDSFWLDNTLKISPDEQLGLMKRLYFDQLPFRKSAQQTIRNVMLQEDNTLYKLSYKTGWGFDETRTNIGWIVGWIEERNHPYFFSLLVKSGDPNVDFITIRKQILTDILKHYGFFEGKK